MKARLTTVEAKLPHKINSSGQLRDNTWHVNRTIEFTHQRDQHVNLTFVDGRIAPGRRSRGTLRDWRVSWALQFWIRVEMAPRKPNVKLGRCYGGTVYANF